MSVVNRQLDVAAVLDAKRNFLARDGLTFCNVYAAVFLGLRGHVIPLTMSANELYDWFASRAAVALGWRTATREEALRVANAGGDVVCVRQVPGGHGHIGVVVESLSSTPGRLCVSAAGTTNFVRAPIERSFGPLKLSDRFFVNVGS